MELCEFIVWDEENYFGEDNQFYTREELKKVSEDFIVFNLDFISEDEPFILTYMDDGEYTDGWKKVKIKIFWGIGNTDIEGNNIYADSSIFEFYYEVKSTGKSIFVKRGYFYFDDYFLQYRIKDLDSKRSYEFANGSRIRNLKIISTLQENPELLKGESDEDN